MTTLLQKMQSTYYIAFKGMYDDVVTGETIKNWSRVTGTTVVSQFLMALVNLLITTLDSPMISKYYVRIYFVNLPFHYCQQIAECYAQVELMYYCVHCCLCSPDRGKGGVHVP